MRLQRLSLLVSTSAHELDFRAHQNTGEDNRAIVNEHCRLRVVGKLRKGPRGRHNIAYLAAGPYKSRRPLRRRWGRSKGYALLDHAIVK